MIHKVHGSTWSPVTWICFLQRGQKKQTTTTSHEFMTYRGEMTHLKECWGWHYCRRYSMGISTVRFYLQYIWTCLYPSCLQTLPADDPRHWSKIWSHCLMRSAALRFKVSVYPHWLSICSWTTWWTTVLKIRQIRWFANTSICLLRLD